jgi:hypothetical protein
MVKWLMVDGVGRMGGGSRTGQACDASWSSGGQLWYEKGGERMDEP